LRDARESGFLDGMSELMDVIESALDAAGPILMRHYGALERIEKKGSIDLVTVADRESEAAIKQIVGARFPSHEVLAEESGAEYAGKEAGYRWVIDPLDGTTNFAHSFPVFSISIAVEHQGQVVAAGVENPYYRERFLAERGSGACLNRQPIRVSSTSALSESLLVSGFPYDRRQNIDRYLAFWREFTMRVHGILRLGSAAMDLCSVACGRLDGFWEEKLHPWDTAAGWLIVEEAGGRVTDFRGGSFSPYGKEILATNTRIHDECLEVLQSQYL
jgi:myo-inositol-1(or 4)-monophosphatase